MMITKLKECVVHLNERRNLKEGEKYLKVRRYYV
jgi:hypothetical protein